ncbi:MAG TPA: hypothetical protein DG048_12950 [Pseudoalteromonas sp.]|nr:hypothetical protein [Pseudoalteromonas sp.]|tara:strand:+ start:344 stop:1105 length:762 start_codon:yes stop_codon:yes gene_type:complete
MNIWQVIEQILKQPSVLKSRTPLLLLSHMRANTSLAGHIIGNHPNIDGYYEMHIGYYSWKSFVRQRLIYSKEHHLKSGGNYMFDKVLHNEHCVSPELLNTSGTKTLLSIRRPETTIPSILKLYAKVNPKHEFANLDGAINYYLTRLEQLSTYSQRIKDFYYFDAEDLRQNTKQCLNDISNYLKLTLPLEQEFKTQKLTGAAKVGDSSGNLNAGRVKKMTSDYTAFDWNKAKLAFLTEKYQNARLLMSENSWHY